ncbi:MAG TPA: hypothetical protein VIL71_08900 [Spirillospora sp.]
MNNAFRGVVLGLALAGTAAMFFATLVSATPSEFKARNLAETLLGGFSMLSCAVIAAGALAGMKNSAPRQAPPYQQHGAVPPQQYPQQASPQQYPQQYGQQPPQ